MGLDNYIMMYLPNDNDPVPTCYAHLQNEDGGYELCYWRRCYRIRNDILELCEIYYNDLGYATKEIPKERVGDLIKILKSYQHRRLWDFYTTFYDWDYAKKMLRRQIHRLKKLRKIKEYRLIFIDSY